MNGSIDKAFWLSVKAGDCCLDIFKEFDENEIADQPNSIQNAWLVDKEISDEMAKGEN